MSQLKARIGDLSVQLAERSSDLAKAHDELNKVLAPIRHHREGAEGSGCRGSMRPPGMERRCAWHRCMIIGEARRLRA